jgi:tetratricopeptide (TPR) repeat protein
MPTNPPLSPDDLFGRAAACQAAGEHARAEPLYRQALQANPENADGWRRLGEVCLALGKLPEAVPAFQRALRLQPGFAAAHLGLGEALAHQGDREGAATCYRNALAFQPHHAEARTHLATVLAEQGKLDEAVAQFREALRLRPDLARAHHNLGIALSQQGRLGEAAESLRIALRLKPDYAEAHYNLGNMLGELGERQEALECYRRAVQARPDYADALNNLGKLLTDLGRPAEAAVVLRQAARLRPGFVVALNNLGLALAELERFAEAEACYLEALRLDPACADAHSNLGNAYKESGRLDEALASYQIAVWLQPDAASTHWNRALTWLQAGDYERGWPEYEWRWRRKSSRPRPFRQPLWDGTPLGGRTILLHPEQGYGDTIQFLRYAPLVKARGGRVLLECHPALAPLLSSCPGLDGTVPEGGPLPDFDVQAPLMSLPALLGTTLATVPAEVPYLSPPAPLAERWRERLGAVKAFRVGVAWQGNRHHPWDRRRSFALAQLRPLARVEGVRLVSLQKGPGAAQLSGCDFPVMDLAAELDEQSGAFLDTAAVMKSLDLVVTADTAVGHLAGALAVPVWVALARVADWRWLLDRQDSPWYPTMRLFRQQETGDWGAVFWRMAAELGRLVAARARPPRVPVTPGELIDKVTILRIKSERMTDPVKLGDVRAELAALEEVAGRALAPSEELGRLTAELQALNEGLWETEDALRLCERARDFGPRFVELARSVYRQNDRRGALKRRVNELLGAPYTEQKSYAEYEDRE